MAESETEQAEEFNGQFTDVFSKTSESEVPVLEKSAPPISDIHVSNDGVIKMMKGFNPSKALGPDELHPRVLKELAVELGPVFAHNICPLYKKGDRALPSNYRPVSLTCVPCKMLEHIVRTNIMAHLEHKLLSDRQHAFRKNRSCEFQLITVINIGPKFWMQEVK